jgi:excisionase family DNA binding protein
MSVAIERLRRLVEVSDPNGTVTIAWIAQLLEVDGTRPADGSGAAIVADDFTVAQLAERFKRSGSTIHDWIRRRGLRAFRLGRELRVTRSELDRWLAEQRQVVAAPRIAAGRRRADLGSWRAMKKAAP